MIREALRLWQEEGEMYMALRKLRQAERHGKKVEEYVQRDGEFPIWNGPGTGY